MNGPVYSLPTAMSSVAGNYTMDSFYLLKENFKNLLFDCLITGKNCENLSYLSSYLLSERWSFQRIHLNVLRDIESDLAYTKVSGVICQFILRSGSLWPPLSISVHKIKRLFSLVISKLMSAFSLTVQFGVANNHITIIREVLEESLYRLTN